MGETKDVGDAAPGALVLCGSPIGNVDDASPSPFVPGSAVNEVAWIPDEASRLHASKMVNAFGSNGAPVGSRPTGSLIPRKNSCSRTAAASPFDSMPE